jgi:NADH-quinone oxidoreductase subunit E
VSFLPGMGVVKGMALTLRRMLQRKATVQYPEVVQDISPKHRGRLILLYDEYGNIKCETCFQCAQACPIEIIDMGGVDTKNRMYVHWGPAEQYAERRQESALRRSGLPVPDATFAAWDSIPLEPLDRILDEEDFDPKRMLRILERTDETYGHLPVAALQHIAARTGAWYSELYGIATSYEHLRLEPPSSHEVGICRCGACAIRGAGRLQAAAEATLGTTMGGASADGAVRLAPADCHGGSPGRAFVTIDGSPQPGMTPDALVEALRRFRAKSVPAARA